MGVLCPSQDSAAACCEACQAAAARGCNVWVWCGNPDGCSGRHFQECWLKRQRDLNTNSIGGQRGEACLTTHSCAVREWWRHRPTGGLLWEGPAVRHGLKLMSHAAPEATAHPAKSPAPATWCACHWSSALPAFAGTNFTSGALYSDAARSTAAANEAARLQALKSNEELPLVWLDVSIKGKPVGRIHFVLFTKEAPRAGVACCC